MKKWFVTFCAFGLITTQAATADAAANQKEQVTDQSVQRIVKMMKENQVENVFADLANDLIGKSEVSFKNFSTKLLVKKVNVEELLKETVNNKQVIVKDQKEAVVPSNNKEMNQQQQNESEKKEEVVETSAPTAQEDATSLNQVPTNQPSTPVVNQPEESTNTTEVTQAVPVKEVETETNAVSEFEAQVVELTNVERAKYGLAPLEMYSPLMAVAREKSEDMARNNYFSHTSPTYGSPFDQMKAAGISYRAAGENIAQGQRTPEEVVQAWMNSEGHRANILKANFTHIGVGYVENGNYWTQQFIQL